MFKEMMKQFLIIISASLLSVQSADPTMILREFCSLVPNNVILKPYSCSTWVICPSISGGEGIEEGDCVHDMYFDKNMGRCDNKQKVNCIFDNKITPNRCANQEDESLFVDNESCNSYIYCFNGNEVKALCPNKTVFDGIQKECVNMENYDCPVKLPNSDNDLICLSIKDDIYFADKNDCGKYNKCQLGVLISYSCDNGYAWDHLQQLCLPLDEAECYPTAVKPEPESKICVDIEGPVSDYTSCSGYYFCKPIDNGIYDHEPEHFNCPPGTYYDSQSYSCRNRVNVPCTLDRCENADYRYVNVAGDCKGYALCEYGIEKTRGVCPDNYYFDERIQLCTLETINYLACAS